MQPVRVALPQTPFRTPLPEEIRGVHITGPLMTLPGKFREYLALERHGLNTVEVDLKDENGNVSFTRGVPTIARRTAPRCRTSTRRRSPGRRTPPAMYLIGRVVTFEDPVTSVAHPELAIKTRDGSVWKTSGGLGWLNPYNRKAWRYDVDVAAAAAKAGFDEIQFDYVRFPSDGDVKAMRLPGCPRAAEERDDSRLLPIRHEAAAPARRPRLGRRLRARRNARARDRPAPAGDRRGSSTRSIR